MPRLPFAMDRFRELKLKSPRRLYVELTVGTAVSIFTFIHCMRLAKQIREKKRQELSMEIMEIAPGDDQAIERLRKIYNIPRATMDQNKP